MRDLIYSIMTDRKLGPVWLIPEAILYAISLIYGLAISLRALLYRIGLFATRIAPVRIVSVGNITLGGTGKTPFVIGLVRIIREEFRKEAAVLIRGYGWDEQAMLKANLPDTPILVGEDRSKSARRSVKLYGTEVAILDDGFQHWELSRDLDIVLVDSRNPFGNGQLFPRGILREAKAALGRADIIVFTKAQGRSAVVEEIKAYAISIKADIRFIEASHKPARLYEYKSDKDLGLGHLGSKKVILISSIGDPDYFEDTVKGLGSSVLKHVVFPDHHNYDERDIGRILRICNERPFDFLVTTEKDAVKLNRMGYGFGAHALMVLGVEIEITSGKEILVDRLNSLFNSKIS